MLSSKRKIGPKPARAGPMQMTASSSYAIHGMGYLATKDPGEVTFLSEISEYIGIPSSYMAKVFQALARAGLVRSFRGAKGGYALARPATEITLREVIEVFEGPVTRSCTLSRGPCNFEPSCGIFRRLAKAQEAFLETLHQFTIAGIGEEFREYQELGFDSRKLNIEE